MGMLDSLGNLGGLGQITKMLDAGNWVKQAVNSVLPKNMAVVGDAAGALFDLKTGNVLGAAQLAMDGLKDLPQAAKSQQQQAASGTLRGAPVPDKPAMEPSPPPTTGKALDIGKLSELFDQILALLGKKPAAQTAGAQAAATTTTQTPTRAPGWRGEPRTPAPAANMPAPATATPATTSAPATTTTTPPPTTTAAAVPAASSAPAASTPAAPSVPAESTPAADTGQTISSLTQLNTMSDGAIRDAVIHGRISPELAKDQTAMMAIQQRMNAISEMNNLMTNMMRALHDMQMAVVQNIRI